MPVQWQISNPKWIDGHLLWSSVDWFPSSSQSVWQWSDPSQFFSSHFLWNCASSALPSQNAEHLLSSSDGSTALWRSQLLRQLWNVLNKPPLRLPPSRFFPLHFIYQISIKYLSVRDLTLILLGVAPHDSRFLWVTSICHLPVMTIATMQTIPTMLVILLVSWERCFSDLLTGLCFDFEVFTYLLFVISCFFPWVHPAVPHHYHVFNGSCACPSMASEQENVCVDSKLTLVAFRYRLKFLLLLLSHWWRWAVLDICFTGVWGAISMHVNWESILINLWSKLKEMPHKQWAFII